MSLTREWLEAEYVQKERSFGDIATELNTYANAVRRTAIKMGIKPRDKSEAQSSALKAGRHTHPTKGKKRSDKTKLAISEGVSKSWQNLSDAAYDKRVEGGKKQWENMSEEQKTNLQSLAIEAVRKTSREGSQLEKFVCNHLRENGILIEFHKKGVHYNNALEVDLFLPEKNIAIEIDGPSHFLPIWGEESLQRTIQADTAKNGILLSLKVNVVRVKQLKKNLSNKNLRDIANAVYQAILAIEANNNTPAQVYQIEVE